MPARYAPDHREKLSRQITGSVFFGFFYFTCNRTPFLYDIVYKGSAMQFEYFVKKIFRNIEEMTMFFVYDYKNSVRTVIMHSSV